MHHTPPPSNSAALQRGGLFALSGSGPIVLAAAAPVETRAIVRGAMDAGLVATGSDAARFADHAQADHALADHALVDWLPVTLSRGSASRPAVYVLQTGVGKVNAAGAVQRLLGEHPSATVINLGICGLLPSFDRVEECAGPSAHPLTIGSVLLASFSVYADEGVQTPGEFKSMGAMGFPLGPFAEAGIAPTPDLAEALRSYADVFRPIATVSTCSGTDALAMEIAMRTAAAGEAMEGAAIGHIIARHNAMRVSGASQGNGSSSMPLARFAELRVVSNTTGDRARQTWDIPKAAARLQELVARMLSEKTDTAA